MSILNHHCTICGSPTFDGMTHTCLSQRLKVYTPSISSATLIGKDMYPSIQKTQEPCMLIPLSLVMDLYAMAVIADNKEVLDQLKKAIRGDK